MENQNQESTVPEVLVLCFTCRCGHYLIIHPINPYIMDNGTIECSRCYASYSIQQLNQYVDMMMNFEEEKEEEK